MGLRFRTGNVSFSYRLTGLALAAVGAFAATLPARAAEESPWWDQQWTVRKKITIDTTSSGVPISEGVSSAPLLLRLLSTNFQFPSARDDGADIRLVAEDGKSVLSHHLERYDSLVAEAFVWVRVPEVKAGAQTTLWMYYGNLEPRGAAVLPKATYDDDTVLVYHFNEKGVPAVDSSGRGNVSLNVGMAVESAMIGGGLKLDGRSGLLIAPSDSLAWGSGPGMTWSAWIKPTELGPNAPIFSQREGANSLVIGLDAGVPYVELTDANGTKRSPTGEPLPTGAWRHLAVTATPSQVNLYVGGEPYVTLSSGLPAIRGQAVVGVEAGDPALPPTGFVGEAR